jgi:hypothetical protein
MSRYGHITQNEPRLSRVLDSRVYGFHHDGELEGLTPRRRRELDSRHGNRDVFLSGDEDHDPMGMQSKG